MRAQGIDYVNWDGKQTKRLMSCHLRVRSDFKDALKSVTIYEHAESDYEEIIEKYIQTLVLLDIST